MHTILVANRGEIACRVIRTARDQGYRTVAVYSDADRGAAHVALAEVAVHIGPSPASQSYLDAAKILDAAKRTGADGIHPGYGFLSEQAAFARACQEAGVTFIGPPAEAIELMGNKSAAKRKMLRAGVPCVPGFHAGEGSPDDATLLAEGTRIGFPLLVKAAAGGGGRGMRLVNRAEDLPAALTSARSEASNAFGSDQLLLERALIDARHIEIQVFGDTHGHTIHLGERDCSVQRRHQKVIEEAPSPAVDEALRARMGAAAVDAAAAIGYVGAGTVEFLLAADGKFYFLEMNTRLQVEHPVTEMVTGFDLVAWQLAIAEGKPLPVDQSQIYPNGHAIEARLYAEDPYAGYLPQSGPVEHWQPPCGPGIRVDHGVCAGQPVTPHYDPMVAKIIAHGDSREQARRRLCRALEQAVLLGTTTNRSFLHAVLQHPSFAAGEATTSFLTTAAPELAEKAPVPSPQAWAVAALIHTLGSAQSLDGWRSSASLAGPLDLCCGEQRVTLARTVHPGALEVANIPGADTSCTVTLIGKSGTRLRVCLDGIQQTVHAHLDDDGQVHLHLAEASFVFAPFHHGGATKADDGVVRAPTGGRVIAVHVEAGAVVERGQPLVVLEAMKIETTLVAPLDGTVVSVAAKQGGQVRQRAVLLEIKPDQEST